MVDFIDLPQILNCTTGEAVAAVMTARLNGGLRSGHYARGHKDLLIAADESGRFPPAFFHAANN
jgi:hypothetical protein